MEGLVRLRWSLGRAAACNVLIVALLLAGCIGKPAPPNGTRRITPSRSTRPKPSARKVKKPATPSLSTPPQRQEERPIDPSGAITPDRLFELYSPAVFKIHVDEGYATSQGSGFFVSSDGVAVSNHHVFGDASPSQCVIILSDGSEYGVSRIYHDDAESDFIIFQVDIQGQVRYINLASTTPKVGERVYAIGSPRGLDNTFSSGEVSQLRAGGDLIQISVPIDHGSSGGVLLNAHGEAVGITSAGIDESIANLNFAINIGMVRGYIPSY